MSGRCLSVFVALVMSAQVSYARPAGGNECVGIARDAERLACFDRAMKPTVEKPAAGEPDYEAMSLIDFKTDRASLAGRRVEVPGLLMPFGEMLFLMDGLGDLSGVIIDPSKAPREDRRRAVACVDGCSVKIRGVVSRVLGTNGVLVDRFVFQ